MWISKWIKSNAYTNNISYVTTIDIIIRKYDDQFWRKTLTYSEYSLKWIVKLVRTEWLMYHTRFIGIMKAMTSLKYVCVSLFHVLTHTHPNLYSSPGKTLLMWRKTNRLNEKIYDNNNNNKSVSLKLIAGHMENSRHYVDCVWKYEQAPLWLTENFYFFSPFIHSFIECI